MHRSLLLLVLGASLCDAQIPSIPPGTRLRIDQEQPVGKLRGTAMSQTADSLTLAAFGAVRTVVPTAAITRIRVSAGRSRVEGALRGIKVGSIAGIPLGFQVDADDRAKGDSALGASLAAGVVTGALFGAVIGGAFGAEKWTTIYSNSMRVGAGRSRNRAPAFGVKLVF